MHDYSEISPTVLGLATQVSIHYRKPSFFSKFMEALWLSTIHMENFTKTGKNSWSFAVQPLLRTSLLPYRMTEWGQETPSFTDNCWETVVKKLEAARSTLCLWMVGSPILSNFQMLMQTCQQGCHSLPQLQAVVVGQSRRPPQGKETFVPLTWGGIVATTVLESWIGLGPGTG